MSESDKDIAADDVVPERIAQAEKPALGDRAPAPQKPGEAIPSQPRSFVPKTQSIDTPVTQSPDAPRPKPGDATPVGSDTVPGKMAAAPAPAAPTSTPTSQATVFPTSPASSQRPTPGGVKISGGGTSALRPQSTATPGGGGDTVRLRVSPKGQPSSLSTGAPRSSPRQRLPDIRRRQTARSTVPTYGPFSIFFGFIWLIFKMIFFTALVLGLGVGLGYAVLWWYIKTPEVTVPNVRGMKIAEAFEVLSEKKLGMVKVRSESSGLVAPGEIVEQSPSAGSTYKQGRAVGVVISSGRSKFTVPNVVGESIENARNKIRGANLEVGNELRMEDPSVPKESVISQQPAANTGLDETQKVHLLVSSGPPGKGLTMPNVTGISFAEAKAALSRLGISDIATDPANISDGTVIGQDPLVGKTILQSDRVMLRLKKSATTGT